MFRKHNLKESVIISSRGSRCLLSWRSNAHWLACLTPPLSRPEYKDASFLHASTSIQSILNTFSMSEDQVCYEELRNLPPDTASTAHIRQLPLWLRPTRSTSRLLTAGLTAIASPPPQQFFPAPDSQATSSAQGTHRPVIRPLQARFYSISLVGSQTGPFQGFTIASLQWRRRNITAAIKPRLATTEGVSFSVHQVCWGFLCLCL
jgi:hypothetical protein